VLTPFPPWLYLWVDGKKWGMPCLRKGSLFLSILTLIIYYCCHAYIKPHTKFISPVLLWSHLTRIYLQELKSSPHICIPTSLHTCYKTSNKSFSLNVVLLELCKSRLNWNKSQEICTVCIIKVGWNTSQGTWTVCIRDLLSDNFILSYI